MAQSRSIEQQYVRQAAAWSWSMPGPSASRERGVGVEAIWLGQMGLSPAQWRALPAGVRRAQLQSMGLRGRVALPEPMLATMAARLDAATADAAVQLPAADDLGGWTPGSPRAADAAPPAGTCAVTPPAGQAAPPATTGSGAGVGQVLGAVAVVGVAFAGGFLLARSLRRRGRGR